MEKHREIESKWWAKEDYVTTSAIIIEHYLYMRSTSHDLGHISERDILHAVTKDEYWRVPGKGQFLRLRNSRGEFLDGRKQTLKEITVKAKDKDSNLDRLEINVEVEKIMDTRELLNTVLGSKPIGVINKREAIVFAGKGVVVSVCEMTDGKVLVEVEGPSIAEIQLHERPLRRKLELVRETASLFELYIEPKLEKE